MVSVGVNIVHDSSSPDNQSTLEGYVFVERVEPNRLFLVDESEQRVGLQSTGKPLSFDGIAVGTRFWLSASERTWRSNPYNSQRSAGFSLRAEPNGPVLLAGLDGTKDAGEQLLGVPITFQKTCSSEPSTEGGACSAAVDLFEARVEADEPVSVLPGTRATASIGGTDYDLALWTAKYVDYPDTRCRPSDWAPSLSLSFTANAQNWQELAAAQPVDATKLPECRLGTDPRLFSSDLNAIDWSTSQPGDVEVPLSPVPGSDDLLFSMGSSTLVLSGLSAQARAVVARGRWLSGYTYSTAVIRESEGGRALAIFHYGRASELSEAVARADVLGTTIALEPRCAWQAGACREGMTTKPQQLYDVVYAGSSNQRAASHERAELAIGDRRFDAWIGGSGIACDSDAYVDATFVARE